MNTYARCKQLGVATMDEPGQYTSWAFGRRLRAVAPNDPPPSKRL